MPIVSITSQDVAVQQILHKELYNSYKKQSTQRGFSFTYNIKTYGCQLNESDSEKIAGFFESLSFTPTTDEAPDVMIFNTCSVRENADDRLFGNLGLIKTVKKNNPGMVVAICGCMMKQSVHVEKIRKSYPFVDLVFGPQDIHRLPELFHQLLSSKKTIVDVSETDYLVDDMDLPIDRSRKFRALVPIMYGCNKFCSFCIVPYVRGRERSRPFSRIIEEVRLLTADGYKEILLLGQSVSAYGKDLTNEPGFPELLTAVAEIPDLYRVRFLSPYPTDITEEVLSVIENHPNIERHIHLPLQSGSNRILRDMNRKYTREEFLRTVDIYRSRFPESTISTDIIVGFPGETEEDFKDTLSLIEAAAFDSAFTFKYSVRQGTKAAGMDNQIPQDTVTERFGRLLELQNSNCRKSNDTVVDTVQEVLIEGVSETAKHIYTGRTSTNRLVNFSIPAETLLPWGEMNVNENTGIDGTKLEGMIARIKILKAKPFSIEGELERFL